jgi:hypothetical protein
MPALRGLGFSGPRNAVRGSPFAVLVTAIAESAATRRS